ncbi:MAG: hypothetical protein ACI3XQ_11895 [Eubacteriales bacterium]
MKNPVTRIICFAMLFAVLFTLTGVIPAGAVGGASGVWDGISVSTSVSGSGTEESPYQINSAADFMYFKNAVSSSGSADFWVLNTDIVINDGLASDWASGNNLPTDGGAWSEPIGGSTYAFCGSFDGQGHSISGVYLSDSSANGLFYAVGRGAVLKNLALVNSCFSAKAGDYTYSGAFAPRVTGAAVFQNLYTDAVISASFDSYKGAMGGIAGYCIPENSGETVEINNCIFAGTAANSATGRGPGGILGRADMAKAAKVYLRDCLNLGSLCGGSHVGGIVGCFDGSKPSSGSFGIYFYDNLNISSDLSWSGTAPTNSNLAALLGGTSVASMSSTCRTIKLEGSEYPLVGPLNTEPAGKVTELTEKDILTGSEAAVAAMTNWVFETGNYPCPINAEWARDLVRKNYEKWLAQGLSFAHEGCSVRIKTGDSGLRFVNSVDKAFTDKLAGIYGESALTFGTLITPHAYVTKADGIFTAGHLDSVYGDTKGHANYLDLVTSGFFEDSESRYSIAGSIVNITTLAKDFSGVAYVRIGDTVVYAPSYRSANISDIAFCAAIDGTGTNEIHILNDGEAQTINSPYTKEQYAVILTLIYDVKISLAD